MKLYCFLFAFALLSDRSIAQNTPRIEPDKVRIINEDGEIVAEIRPAKPIKKVNIRLDYYWYSSNKINRTEGGFSGKLLHGKYQEFFHNKNLKMDGFYNKGLKSGTWKTWNENGTLLAVENWKNGVKSGPFKLFDDSGRVKEQGYFQNNLLNGEHHSFTDSGKMATDFYDRGSLVPAKSGRRDRKKKQSLKKAPSEERVILKPAENYRATGVFEAKAKASALYIVIVISLVIAVLCSSLITSAYFYKLQYHQKLRYHRLKNNLESGIHILLSKDSTYVNEVGIDLYANGNDSISLKTYPWGLFDVGVVKAFKQQDTLSKSFLIANVIDSVKWAALYVIDEQHPLYISGDAAIKGAAYLPESGIMEAIVDGKTYKGDKRLVVGPRRKSRKDLPALSVARLNYLKNNQGNLSKSDTSLKGIRVLSNAFSKPVKQYIFNKKNVVLANVKLQGNIVLYSENLIVIDSTSSLKDILVFAKGIVVKNGFRGRCQLFATDSIVTGRNCVFDYPSSLSVFNFNEKKVYQPRIKLGEGSVLNGVLFSYEKKKSDVQTLIDCAKNTTIQGQVFSKGMVRFNGRAQVNGSLSAHSLIYESNSSLYENHLIDTKIDIEKLSPYYLTSSMFNVSSDKRKVLQWLDIK